MFFEAVRTEQGCMSYVVGCEETWTAAVIDPAVDAFNRYAAIASSHGFTVRYVVDTHTHADHFSATRELAGRLGVPTVMHQRSDAPFVDLKVCDGETLVVGKLRIRIMHTPGHTADSMCLVLPDRVITGDTLLLGACGRTDLPSGDPEALYDSLVHHLLKLDSELLVFPAHNYKGKPATSLGEQMANNPRLQVNGRGEFVEMMESLNLTMPHHLTEALRTNRSGGKSVQQLIDEAASRVVFMAPDELSRRVQSHDDIVPLDVREKSAYEAGHIPGAVNLPRGQLELQVDKVLPDPSTHIVTYCDFGKISTLAAKTLREMGFTRTVALDGGFREWADEGYPFDTGGARRSGTPDSDP